MSDFGSEFDRYLGNEPKGLGGKHSREQSTRQTDQRQPNIASKASSVESMNVTNDPLITRKETRLMARERQHDLSEQSRLENDRRIARVRPLTRDIMLPRRDRRNPPISSGADSIISSSKNDRLSIAGLQQRLREVGDGDALRKPTSHKFELGPSLFSFDAASNLSDTSNGLDAALNSRFSSPAVKASLPPLKKSKTQRRKETTPQKRYGLSKESGAPIMDQFDLASFGGGGGESDYSYGDQEAGEVENARQDAIRENSLQVPSPLNSETSVGTDARYQETSRMPAIAETSQENASVSTEDELRPRDPHEAEVPLIFSVPLDEIQQIMYRDDENIDETYLEQRLEWSESGSEDESDPGSIVEMIDDSTDSDVEYELPQDERNTEWQPAEEEVMSDGSQFSDDDAVQALTESESDIDVSEVEEETVSSARMARGKRHRIPRVEFWNGERIEYEPEGKSGLLTAIGVRRVIPAVKHYRPRRTPRRRNQTHEVMIDDFEADSRQPDIQVPIFNPQDQQWHTETVAKSVVNSGFKPVTQEDGEIVPLVSRSDLFGGDTTNNPLHIYMLRVEVGGTYSRLLESQKSSLFLCWSGKCTMQLNTQKFDLPKGIAVYAPPANDLFIENGGGDSIGQGTVTLFVIEFDGAISREFAQAMVEGAASMVSRSSQMDLSKQLDLSRQEPEAGSLLQSHQDSFDNDNEDQGGFDDDIGVEGPALHDIDFSVVNKSAAQEDETESFYRGFSKAVGNPELSNRSHILIPARRVDSDEISESLSIALQGGEDAPQPWSGANSRPLRYPRQIHTRNTSRPSHESLSTSQLRSINRSQPPNSSRPLSALTRDYLIRRHRQIQLRREEDM